MSDRSPRLDGFIKAIPKQRSTDLSTATRWPLLPARYCGAIIPAEESADGIPRACNREPGHA